MSRDVAAPLRPWHGPWRCHGPRRLHGVRQSLRCSNPTGCGDPTGRGGLKGCVDTAGVTCGDVMGCGDPAGCGDSRSCGDARPTVRPQLPSVRHKLTSHRFARHHPATSLPDARRPSTTWPPWHGDAPGSPLSFAGRKPAWRTNGEKLPQATTRAAPGGQVMENGAPTRRRIRSKTEPGGRRVLRNAARRHPPELP